MKPIKLKEVDCDTCLTPIKGVNVASHTGGEAICWTCDLIKTSIQQNV